MSKRWANVSMRNVWSYVWQCVTRPKIWTIPIPRLFSVPNFLETDSETFFGTKIFRDRFRDFFRYSFFSRPIPRLFSVPNFFETGSGTIQKSAKIPGTGRDRDPNQHKCSEKFWDWLRYFFLYQFFSRPIPILFSVPNFFETDSETFFGTKFFRDRFRDFFRYLIFPRPVPRLFSVPIFFETGSETFFGTKFFRFRFRYHQKNWRIPGNGNSRDRDVTLCRPGHHPE